MSTRLAKFAPIGVVAGAMGYFCWPYLDDPEATAQPKESANATEMTAALLSPPAAPGLDHDPFNMPVHSSGSATPDRAVKTTAGEASGPKSPAGRASNAATAPARLTATRTARDSDKFVLNGTYVQGDRRMAVINGSLYAEGEQISPSGPASVMGTIARVDSDRVVLKLGEETAELSYSTPASQSAADWKATPPAMGVVHAAREKHAPAVDWEVRTSSASAGEPHSAGAPPAGAANDIPGKKN